MSSEYQKTLALYGKFGKIYMLRYYPSILDKSRDMIYNT